MRKSKVLVLVLIFALLTCSIFAVTASAFAKNDTAAGDKLAADSWVAAPQKTLVKCGGGECDHTACDYVYSFAVVGDTQNLNYIDAGNYAAAKKENPSLTYAEYESAHMRTLYNWILKNKDSKNIQYVMGLGDVTQSFNTSQTYYTDEWALAKEALSLLDGKLGYSLVRGNHDISSGFNGAFGSGTAYYNAITALSETTDGAGRPMAGFRDASKIEDSYRKIVTSNGDKYIIFTLEYYPTEQTVEWLNETLSANSDYSAVITLHAFLNKDSSFVDDFETTTPSEDSVNSNWSQTATGGNVSPRTLWENTLSKHANVKLILSGHVAAEDIVVNQLKGESGNTVTCMLIDGQTIDSTIEPVGLVAMFYVAADGSVMKVEYISTVRAEKNDSVNVPAYLKNNNQFEITIDHGSAWTETVYGDVPTATYNANTFNIFLDDDKIADNTNFFFGGYNTWEETLNAIHKWNGIGGVGARQMKTYNILMTKNYTYSNGIAPKSSGSNPGRFNLDLGDNTITLAGNGVLVPFYNSRTDASPSFTVKNGSVVMSDEAKLAVLQTSIKEPGSKLVLNLEELDVTYNGSVSPIVGMYDGTAGSNGSVDLNVTDCKINTVSASGAVTLFNLNDKNNNNNVKLTLAGGSVVGTTSANTVIYSLNAGSDTAFFAADENGNYTTVTLNESASPVGIFRNAEGKLLNFVTESTAAPYLFKAELAPVEETAYGSIPTDVYPAEQYPFVLFSKGEIVATYTSWREFCQNIYAADTSAARGTVLYLRADHNSTEKPSDQLRNVKNLTIDLGDNVLTGTGGVLFNLVSSSNYNFTTNITVKNGTLTTAKSWAPIVAFNSNNTTDVDCKFNVTFDGVTINAAEGFEGRLLAEAWTGGTDGSTNTITVNNCTLDATVGTVSSLFTLNEKNDQNKIDVAIYINGGKLISNKYFTLGTFSAEREEGKGSPDTLTLGKGSDGNAFFLEMPNTVTHPTTGIQTASGLLYPVETSDDGTSSTYCFESIVTKYGTIKTDYLSIVDHPYVVFKNGSCNSSGSVWNSASDGAVGVIPNAIKAASSASDIVTVLVRKDIEHSASKTVNTFHNLKGTLNVDFGGHTITTSRELFQINQKNFNNTIRINFFNGSIVVTSRRLGAFSNQHTTANTRQDLIFTFTDMYIGYKSVGGSSQYGDLINQNGGNSTSEFFCTADLIFDNCVIDLTGHKQSTVNCTVITAAADTDTGKHATHVIFKGGEIRMNDAHTYTLASRKTGYPDGEADTLKFEKSKDGKYTRFVMISTENVPSEMYDSEGISIAKVSDNGTEIVYQIGEDIKTEYGTIPFAYFNVEEYPFALFKNGEMIHAFLSWKTFIDKMADNLEHQSGCVLILRRDFTTDQGSAQNMCYITDIVIDLQGHKLIRGAYHLFQAYGKLTSTASKTTSVTVKNGAVLVGANNAPIAFNNTTNGARHKFDFTFESIVFGRVGNVTGKLVAESFTGGTYGSDNTITLNNCIISLVNDEKYGTVAPTGAAAWFDLTDNKTGYDDGFNNITVIINGGEVRLAGASLLSLGTMDNAGDSITFAKNDGNYTAFTLPAGAVAPTVSINGGGLKFVKISDDGETVTYRLRPAAVAELDFVPKMSLTLDRDLILNIYVPAKSFLNSFTLDGVEYADLAAPEKVTLGDAEYYLVKISLDAKSAARDIVLRVNVNIGDKTATGTFTFGIIKYAEKILADGSDVEKTLVRDVLSYVRAAYAYFKTEDADTVSRINAILGENYDASNAPAIEGSATATTSGLKSATFSLDGTPAMRFYLADGADASKYAFFIDGTRVKTETSADGTYIDIDVYAYALCETVTYTIDGVESGSFHINTYYEWSKTQNNENLVNLVARFWKYLQSARAYRDSVVEA